MKCAMELIKIKEEAEKEYEIYLDELCKKAHLEAIEDTIKWCENTIGPKLESNAKNRLKIEFEMRGQLKKDRLGNSIFYPLEEGYHKITAFRYYDVITLTNYLSQFCYKVDFSHEWYYDATHTLVVTIGEKKC